MSDSTERLTAQVAALRTDCDNLARQANALAAKSARLRGALELIALLGDTRTPEYESEFGSEIGVGWRVVEKILEIALEAIA